MVSFYRVKVIEGEKLLLVLFYIIVRYSVLIVEKMGMSVVRVINYFFIRF